MINKHFALLLLTIFITCTTTISKAQTYKKVTEVKGLPAGVKAPEFQAKDQHGNTFNLSKALKKGPVVVVFYRGQWCSFCNKHMSSLQDSLQQIQNTGATVVAISPEKTDNLKKTSEKTGAKFPLLFDEGYKISDAFDVTFVPEKSLIDFYNTKLNAKLGEAQSDSSNRLPIPATYIIDQKGVITWRQFDPDYRKRASASEIIRNIPRKK